MAKRPLPIKEFQDMLNMYVANGRFPRQQKIVKNDTMDKVLEVEPNGKVSFVAYIEDT